MPDKKSLIKRLSIKTIKIAMGELQNKNKKCQVCGKEFTKIFNLKQHLLIHGTKKGKKTQSSKKDWNELRDRKTSNFDLYEIPSQAVDDMNIAMIKSFFEGRTARPEGIC